METAMDDRQLLERYVVDGSDESFGQLVTRQLNLVYSDCAALAHSAGAR